MAIYSPGPALVANSTAGNQFEEGVATLSNGNYVVVSDNNVSVVGGASSGEARIFGPSGRPITAEIAVPGDAQAITALRDGGFAVAFRGINAAGTVDVGVQLFNQDGTARGGPTILATASGALYPAVTSLADGRVVVAWVSFDDTGSSTSTFNSVFQILNADGSPAGAPTTAGPAIANGSSIGSLSLATTAGGGFGLVRNVNGPPIAPSISASRVEAETFDADGQPASGLITVDGTAARGATATSLTDGRIAVEYTSGTDPNSYSVANSAVFFRTVAADGTLGPVITAASGASQFSGHVTGLPNGDLFLTYGESGRTVGTEFTPDGARIGQPVQGLGFGDVTPLAGGAIAAVGSAQTGASFDVFSRVLTPVGPTSDPDGTPLVNDAYYLARYGDVAAAGQDPDDHYHLYGWKEGRDPDALFSTVAYRYANRDVFAANIDPLQQYDLYGWKEGRDPSASFDTQLYLNANPDVKAAGIDPLAHYLQYGRAEGRQIYAAVGSSGIDHGSFDAEYYLLANPDVAESGMDAYQHYESYGWKEGRNPNAYFDVTGYLNAYGDVKAAGIDPLMHYDQYGWTEGRDPSGLFDTTNYLAANRDVAAAGIDPLTHFLQYGAQEGRLPLGDGVLDQH